MLLPRLMAVAARVLEALKNYLGRMIDNGQPKGDNEQLPRGGKS